MKESSCSPIMAFLLRRIKAVAFLGCALFMCTQPVGAESLSDTSQGEVQVVAKKRVEKNIPGTYHYESQYKMTKDEKGNYHSTYESQKNEWFCCLDWFSSEDEPSTKASKS